jgi:hypothetical protein
MFRKLLVVTLCLALAAMNLAGVHVHFVDDDHGDHEHAAHAAEHGHGAHAITALDQHHDDEHGHEGGLDLDPAVKAFGKLSLTLLPLVALWFYVLVARSASTAGLQLPHAAPLRPPNLRSAFYILPPSHAPPTPAFAR